MKYYSLVTLCLALASAQAGVVNPLSSGATRSADNTLMQFMLDSRILQQTSPGRSLECFDYYLPVLSAIANKYEQDYAVCLSEANAQRDVIDAATQPQREKIESAAVDSCASLHACTHNANSIDYFQCFTTEGSTSAKQLYSISSDAAEILSEVREQYRLVENKEQRCYAKAERIYVESAASAYEELQSCLEGKTPVPTTVAPPVSTVS